MESELMKTIAMGIFLLCGYLFLLGYVSGRIQSRRQLPVLSVLLLVLYLAVGIPFMMILSSMGDTSFVMMTLLLLLSCIVLLVLVAGLIRHFGEINHRMLILFLLYVLMVSYITIFSRSEGHSRAIMLHFDQLTQAIRTGSLEPLQHSLLNAVLFIPLGILFPMIWPGHLNRLLYVAPLGLMLSTLIESIQMFFFIGQCDLEDIVANTLGAVIGYGLYALYTRLFGRYLPEDDEDEDEEDEDEDDDEEA